MAEIVVSYFTLSDVKTRSMDGPRTNPDDEMAAPDTYVAPASRSTTPDS
jgi:hypothetical protein